MRSWSVMAMTSRSPRRATWSRIGHDVGRAVGGDGVDVQVGAPASARGSRGLLIAACAAPAHASAAASRSGQIGKKTAHHCSGASCDDALEGAGQAGRRRRDALAPRALGRHVDRLEPSAVLPAGAPPDADHVRPAPRSRPRASPGRAAGRGRPEERRSRSRRRSGRGRRRGPTLVPSRSAVEQLAARLAQPDDADADGAPGAHEPGLQPGVVDRLHRRHGATDPARRGSRPGSSIGPEMQPDEDRPRRPAKRLGDDVRGLDGQPRGEVSGVDRRVSARPRGSSARRAGTRARTRRSRARGSVRGGPAAGGPAPVGRAATRRPGAGSAGPGRPARASRRYHRSPAISARAHERVARAGGRPATTPR